MKETYEIFERTNRLKSSDPYLYVAFEQCTEHVARSNSVGIDVDSVRTYVQTYMVLQNALGYETPYSQASREIFNEFIPDRNRLTTHFLQVGHKYKGHDRVSFFCVPLHLKTPAGTDIDVIEISGFVFSTVKALTRIPEIPMSSEIKHSYYRTIFQSLFTAWINERKLVSKIEQAAKISVYPPFSLHD